MPAVIPHTQLVVGTPIEVQHFLASSVQKRPDLGQRLTNYQNIISRTWSNLRTWSSRHGPNLLHWINARIIVCCLETQYVLGFRLRWFRTRRGSLFFPCPLNKLHFCEAFEWQAHRNAARQQSLPTLNVKFTNSS